MAGLLYKDILGTFGKKALWVVGVLSLLTLSTMVVNNEDYVWLVGAMIVLEVCMLPFQVAALLPMVLFRVDEGRNIKAYIGSLPFEPGAYIKAKYIFLLITYYAALSLAVFMITLVIPPMKECLDTGLLESVPSILPLYVCSLVMVSALEMPFHALLGVNKANAIKAVILGVCFFLAMGYFLFGDLSIMEKVDFEKMIEYLKTHPQLSLELSFGIPLAAGVLYYLSYKITCFLYCRKELQDE